MMAEFRVRLIMFAVAFACVVGLAGIVFGVFWALLSFVMLKLLPVPFALIRFVGAIAFFIGLAVAVFGSADAQPQVGDSNP